MTIKSQNLTDDEKNQIISRSTSEKSKSKESKLVTPCEVVGLQNQTVDTPVLEIMSTGTLFLGQEYPLSDFVTPPPHKE